MRASVNFFSQKHNQCFTLYTSPLPPLLLLGPVSVVGMLQGEVLDQRNPPLPSQTFKNLQNANCFSRTNLQNAKCFSLVSFQMFVKAKYKFNGKSEHYLGELLRVKVCKVSQNIK